MTSPSNVDSYDFQSPFSKFPKKKKKGKKERKKERKSVDFYIFLIL